MLSSRAAGSVALRTNLVRQSLLAAGSRLPAVLEPAAPGLDPAEWCARNRVWLDELLLEHGAVLFRNFALPGVREFERLAAAAYGELYGDYGDLPRNPGGEKIYESTPYPADQMILWHNESAHLSSWPMRIAFYCLVPPRSGGCTPVIDTRSLMRRLDADIVDAFRTKGLTYVRNFADGIAPTWQQFFHTGERARVEALCREAGAEFEWRPGGSLRVSQPACGVARHPQSGEDVFFNQVQHHHIACLDAETREGLRALFDEDDLPRHVRYGDGTPIPDEVMERIGAVYRSETVRFAWQKGDVLMLDNMLTSHARDPFEGPRHIVVAMGRIARAEPPPG